jgi:hypothetical protein
LGEVAPKVTERGVGGSKPPPYGGIFSNTPYTISSRREKELAKPYFRKFPYDTKPKAN